MYDHLLNIIRLYELTSPSPVYQYRYDQWGHRISLKLSIR